MKYILSFIIFFCVNLYSIQNDKNFENISNEIKVKVLLHQINNFTDQFLIFGDNGLIIKNNNKKKITNKIEIKLGDNCFYLNNLKISKKAIHIESNDGYLKFNNNKYQGSFIVYWQDNNLYLINKIDLEDYIFSVLKTESWPGWPLEVNKVFAIACRSYVVAKFLESRNKKSIYHIINTNKHQTYSGFHSSKLLKDATLQTKGVIIGYQNKPALAMFDSCCGGIIPANMKGINFDVAPYLARKKQCTFCKTCKLFSWKIEYDKSDFEKILKTNHPNLKNLKSFNIIKDKAGITQLIEINDAKKKYSFTGKKFYSLFDKIKSFCFSIKKNAKKIVLNGNGYGHHLGICQWGAREMVNKGWDYKSILKFYYPGISFMKLQVKSKLINS